MSSSFFWVNVSKPNLILIFKMIKTSKLETQFLREFSLNPLNDFLKYRILSHTLKTRFQNCQCHCFSVFISRPAYFNKTSNWKLPNKNKILYKFKYAVRSKTQLIPIYFVPQAINQSTLMIVYKILHSLNYKYCPMPEIINF